MFKDFMNNDCGGGNEINNFTKQIFDNRMGSQQESWHEELQNFNMEKPPIGEYGEIYNNNNNQQLMRMNDQRERMFEMGMKQEMHMNEKNQFYFSQDDMLKDYQQFKPMNQHTRNHRNVHGNQRNMNKMIQRGEDWGQEYHQVQHQSGDWSNEYQKEEEWAQDYENDWSSQYQSNLDELEEDYERVYSGQDQNKDWTSEYEEYNMEKAFEDNEKQEQEDEDWFEDYLQKEKQFSEESMKSVTEQLLNINDPKLQNSNFMKFIGKVHTGEFTFENNTLVSKQPLLNSKKNVSWEDEYGNQHQQEGPNDMIHEYNQFQQNNEVNEMVNDFQNFRVNHENEMVREYMNGENEKDDYVNEYHGYAKDEEVDVYDEIWNEEGSWNAEKVKPKQYLFSKDNPYLSLDHPYEKGIELMDNGRIKDAILAFEAEVAKDPQNVKAWHMLGKAHAEGDKDEQAIEALKNAIRLEPDNLETYIDIAVSFTNTMHKDKALQALEQWFSRNDKYKEIADKFGFKINEGWLDNYSGMSLRSMYERHDYVANAFIEAARLNVSDIDPDIQIILGLLYNISMDYDKAVECFRAALFKKPEDYTLWNKLGATLANNNRSEEAVEAYLNALEQKPLYVRAIANLGISFVALSKYEDAAKQFLSALSLEPSAKHIWSNLENSFSFMDRHDLIDKIGEMNPEVFRKYIDF